MQSAGGVGGRYFPVVLIGSPLFPKTRVSNSSLPWLPQWEFDRSHMSQYCMIEGTVFYNEDTQCFETGTETYLKWDSLSLYWDILGSRVLLPGAGTQRAWFSWSALFIAKELRFENISFFAALISSFSTLLRQLKPWRKTVVCLPAMPEHMTAREE